MSVNAPENLKYTESHEWVEIDGDIAKVGLTDYAQDQLGDLVFINLPEVDDEIVAGDPFADAESVKAVSEVYTPVSGIVAEVNDVVLDSPEQINADPYGTWFITVKNAELGMDIMDAEAYIKFCDEQ